MPTSGIALIWLKISRKYWQTLKNIMCSYPMYRPLLGLPILSFPLAETLLAVLGLDCEKFKDGVDLMIFNVISLYTEIIQISAITCANVHQVFLQM